VDVHDEKLGELGGGFKDVHINTQKIQTMIL
jgi:hypothetical protein